MIRKKRNIFSDVITIIAIVVFSLLFLYYDDIDKICGFIFYYLITTVIVIFIGMKEIIKIRKFENKDNKKQYFNYFFKQISLILMISGIYLINVFKLFTKNENIILIPLMLACFIYIGSNIFGIFINSRIFDDFGILKTCLISILIAISIITDKVEEGVVKVILNVILIIISSVLTIKLIKCILIDKYSIKEIQDIVDIFILTITTICITVYTFYELLWNDNLTEQILFNSAISIYSALIGGSITLAGVAWTIKKSEIEKSEEKRKEIEPFFYGSIYGDKDQNIIITFFNDQQKDFCDFIILKYIKNSSKVEFKIEKLVVNEIEYQPRNNNIVGKNESISIKFNFCEGIAINKIILHISDISYNLHEYEIILTKGIFRIKEIIKLD